VPGKLSVVIPCFNEEHHIRALLEKVISVKLDHNLEKEIIILNDGSTDRTSEVLKKILSENPGIQAFDQPVNMGKGAAIRTGLSKITGDIVIIQDADLEYDPTDYNNLLQFLLPM